MNARSAFSKVLKGIAPKNALNQEKLRWIAGLDNRITNGIMNFELGALQCEESFVSFAWIHFPWVLISVG